MAPAQPPGPCCDRTPLVGRRFVSALVSNRGAARREEPAQEVRVDVAVINAGDSKSLFSRGKTFSLPNRRPAAAGTLFFSWFQISPALTPGSSTKRELAVKPRSKAVAPACRLRPANRSQIHFGPGLILGKVDRHLPPNGLSFKRPAFLCRTPRSACPGRSGAPAELTLSNSFDDFRPSFFEPGPGVAHWPAR